MSPNGEQENSLENNAGIGIDHVDPMTQGNSVVRSSDSQNADKPEPRNFDANYTDETKKPPATIHPLPTCEEMDPEGISNSMRRTTKAAGIDSEISATDALADADLYLATLNAKEKRENSGRKKSFAVVAQHDHSINITTNIHAEQSAERSSEPPMSWSTTTENYIRKSDRTSSLPPSAESCKTINQAKKPYVASDEVLLSPSSKRPVAPSSTYSSETVVYEKEPVATSDEVVLAPSSESPVTPSFTCSSKPIIHEKEPVATFIQVLSSPSSGNQVVPSSTSSGKMGIQEKEPVATFGQVLSSPSSESQVVPPNIDSVKDKLVSANAGRDYNKTTDKDGYPFSDSRTSVIKTAIGAITSATATRFSVSSTTSVSSATSGNHTTAPARSRGIMISVDEETPKSPDSNRKRRSKVTFDIASVKRKKISGMAVSDEDDEDDEDGIVDIGSGKKDTVTNDTVTGGRSDVEEEDVSSKEEEYEVEAIIDHKVYRSNAVKYEIKWVGYSSEQNTWEPAKSIHQSCPELCAAYWLKKKIPVPINVPLIPHAPQVPAALRRYANRLSEKNIAEDSILPEYREQGFQLAYWQNYPKPDTAWEKELRAIHCIRRVEGSDQILAYVSWMNTKKTVHAIQELHERCPDQVVRYYEARLSFD